MTEREREATEDRRSSARAWATAPESKFEKTSFKIPEDFKEMKLKTPNMLIDVMEYAVGPNNRRCDEGYLHFELSYDVHRVPLPDGAAYYCCLWHNWKEACPVCDWTRDNARSQPEKLIKDLRPQLRHLWNVIDLNTRDQKVQILDTNHFNRGSGFGEQIKKALLAVPQYENFARWDTGYSLAITVDDLTMGEGRKYQAATRIDFVPRQRPWNKSILKECCRLEDTLIHHDYDTLRKLFLQQGTPSTKTTSLPPAQNAGPDPRREAPRDRDMSEPPRQAEAPRHEAPPPPRQPDADPRRGGEIPPTARQDAPPRHDPAPAPAVPPPPGQGLPKAQDYGIKVGMMVVHPKHGRCEVVRISGDGTSLTIEDVKNGLETRGVGPEEVKLADAAPPPPTQPPAPAPSQNGSSRRSDDEFDRRPTAATEAPGRSRRDD